MSYKKRSLQLLLPLLFATGAVAQDVISLDSCRAMAIRNNKELKMAEIRKDVAHWNRKSAFTNYLPKVVAAGAYMYTSREISLLNSDQKAALSNLGETTSQVTQLLMQNIQPMIQPILSQYPVEVQQKLMQSMQSFASVLPTVAGEAGQKILDAFRTDTRNAGMFSVMLTQPLFMGGKIIAYNKITKYAEQIASSKHELEMQNVIVAVDETYWRIVQLNSKKKLAQSYLDLIKKLDGDVEQLIKEGFATKADGLSVKVKLNEAEVTMIQINNGLSLLKMLLAQQCGMEEYEFTLADENRDTFELEHETIGDAEIAMAQRPELQQLQLASDIYRQKVKIARSEFLPTLALTGGYLLSNPSVFNGFENKFKGMFTVGVGLKVPVITWGDRVYKVRAAQAEARIADLHKDEISEKIHLQVKQCQQKLDESKERLSVAEKSKAQADENLRYAEFGLKEGVIPLSNVLAAQTAWLSAHSTFVTAQIDMLLADLYLRKSLGTVTY